MCIRDSFFCAREKIIWWHFLVQASLPTVCCGENYLVVRIRRRWWGRCLSQYYYGGGRQWHVQGSDGRQSHYFFIASSSPHSKNLFANSSNFFTRYLKASFCAENIWERLLWWGIGVEVGSFCISSTPDKKLSQFLLIPASGFFMIFWCVFGWYSGESFVEHVLLDFSVLLCGQ